MFTKKRKNIAGILISFSCLLINCFNTSAQSFHDLPKSEYDDSFVDTFLPADESLGSLTIDKNNWDLKYYDQIFSASATNEGPKTFVEKNKKTGKSVTHNVLASPYVYYAILDMPSGDRFYGIVTTGYDDMETIINKPNYDWHPYTKVEAVSGTVVDANGNQSDFTSFSDADLYKPKNIKPVGTYYIDDFGGYERVSFTFYQGGTGSLKLVPYVHTQRFITYSGGDLKKKTASGRVKRRTNVVMGGPHSWQISSKQNFKWSIDDWGTLTITPTGAVTIIPKDWVTEGDGNTYWSSKADSIRSRRQAENDHKYLHDEIIEYNKEMKISAKKDAEIFGAQALSIFDPQITKTEIIGNIGSFSKSAQSKIHLKTELADKLPNKLNEMKLAYAKEVYNNVPLIKKTWDTKRKFGVDIQYSKWKDRTKIFVVRNKDIFGVNPDYTVFNPSVKNGKANIVFYNNGKRCIADLHFNNEGKIDIDKLKQSITFDNEIEENNAKIDQLNSQILEYKKDKRRRKIIKEYEKELRYSFIPSTFSNASEFQKIIKLQKELIKNQQETLDLLK